MPFRRHHICPPRGLPTGVFLDELSRLVSYSCDTSELVFLIKIHLRIFELGFLDFARNDNEDIIDTLSVYIFPYIFQFFFSIVISILIFFDSIVV